MGSTRSESSQRLTLRPARLHVTGCPKGRAKYPFGPVPCPHIDSDRVGRRVIPHLARYGPNRSQRQQLQWWRWKSQFSCPWKWERTIAASGLSEFRNGHEHVLVVADAAVAIRRSRKWGGLWTWTWPIFSTRVARTRRRCSIWNRCYRRSVCRDSGERWRATEGQRSDDRVAQVWCALLGCFEVVRRFKRLGWHGVGT